MRRISVLCLVALFALGMILASSSDSNAGPKNLPKITGGGITENGNWDPFDDDEQLLLSIGGFNARATEDVGSGVYLAKGQIQAKAVVADNPRKAIGTIHGEVVCIANLGADAEVTQGGVAGTAVWEIRFLVTRARGDFTPPVGAYGSAYVQDNGAMDYSDENFGPPFDHHCGNETRGFGLERVIAGNLTVHN